MELRQLRYFCAIAREGHFRSAADVLSVAQPALSQQILRLERELGVKLFERNSRRVRLTAAGEVFLSRAQRVIADVEKMRHEVGVFGGVGGRLRLGWLPSMTYSAPLLSDLIAQFNSAYPSVQVSVREQYPPQLYRALSSREMDIAFTTLQAGDAPPPEITTKHLFKGYFGLVMAPTHPWAKRKQVALRELEGQPLIRLAESKPDLLGAAADEMGFQLNVAFEVAGAPMLRVLAARGLGIGVCPNWGISGEAAGLGVARITSPHMSCYAAVIWARDEPCTPAAQAFLALALELRKGVRSHHSVERLNGLSPGHFKVPEDSP